MLNNQKGIITMKTIKWETADNMMSIVAFVVMKAKIEHGEQVDIETIKEFAFDMFQEYCDTVGITEVEDADDEKADNGFASKKNYDPAYSLTAKCKFIRQYVNNGHTFEEACLVANILFGKMEGE
jgi:hypothetical protein